MAGIHPLLYHLARVLVDVFDAVSMLDKLTALWVYIYVIPAGGLALILGWYKHIYVAFTHGTVLDLPRGPAHSVSVPILYPRGDKGLKGSVVTDCETGHEGMVNKFHSFTTTTVV